MSDTPRSEDLTVAEALELLGNVRFGRVVFTSKAMPTVRPVRHVLAGGQIVIAAGPELVLGTAGAGGDTILAYEADQLDSSGSSGWSVVVVGRATRVSGGARERLYRRMLPLAAGDQLVVISTDLVAGFRLTPREGSTPVPAGG